MSFEMYQENILDHYNNPRNYGTIENPDIKFHDVNPLCGDEYEFQFKIDKNGKIVDVKFHGNGCAISKASASILTETVKGKNIREIKNLGRKNVLKNLGITISPPRLKCAMLPLKVVKVAVYSYLGNQKEIKEFEKEWDKME
ncbi:MAG: SUF system NifU family Fe-S cluster assembly protein [Candidatus Aenigmarchaeota archaeon]|nr:SUF system NifU family Fe-S cluster assembly protein [Candidatus Aenigmarchaeota archaeon]